jgi:hypothetical protein
MVNIEALSRDVVKDNGVGFPKAFEELCDGLFTVSALLVTPTGQKSVDRPPSA